MQKNALIFGMSLDDFWYGNPLLFYLYRDAYIQKRKDSDYIADSFAYQQGFYYLRALRQVMRECNINKNSTEQYTYPKEPLLRAVRRDEGKSEIDIVKEQMMKHVAYIKKK